MILAALKIYDSEVVKQKTLESWKSMRYLL